MKTSKEGVMNLIEIPNQASKGYIQYGLLPPSERVREVILIESLSTPQRRISWYQDLNGMPETYHDASHAISVVTVMTTMPMDLDVSYKAL